jgi:hypothetical protein
VPGDRQWLADGWVVYQAPARQPQCSLVLLPTGQGCLSSRCDYPFQLFILHESQILFPDILNSTSSDRPKNLARLDKIRTSWLHSKYSWKFCVSILHRKLEDILLFEE